MTIPLIVGVTGHRDIPNEELDALAACARALFEKLKSDFPDLPIRVLNPMAEGADQLVCQVALDMGISVYALLPMPLAEYEKTL